MSIDITAPKLVTNTKTISFSPSRRAGGKAPRSDIFLLDNGKIKGFQLLARAPARRTKPTRYKRVVFPPKRPLVDRLIEELDGPPMKSRERAAIALGRLGARAGEKSIAPLVKVLSARSSKGSGWQDRRAAARALGLIRIVKKNGSPVHSLMAVAKNNSLDWKIRQEAIWALGELGPKVKNRSLRRQVRGTLKKLAATRVDTYNRKGVDVVQLRLLLESRDVKVRENAAFLLGVLGPDAGKGSIAPLSKLLLGKVGTKRIATLEDRKRAAWALGQMGLVDKKNSKPHTALIKAATSKSEEIREEVARTLGIIWEVLKDGDWKKRIEKVLCMLGDDTYGDVGNAASEAFTRHSRKTVRAEYVYQLWRARATVGQLLKRVDKHIYGGVWVDKKARVKLNAAIERAKILFDKQYGYIRSRTKPETGSFKKALSAIRQARIPFVEEAIAGPRGIHKNAKL